MSLIESLDFEWWQALIIACVMMLSPLMKAFAVVLVGRCVKAKIAKVALPLMFRPRRAGRLKKPTSQHGGEDVDSCV